MMKVVKHLLKRNPCYKAGRKIKVEGLMLHSVGCPQPDAAVFLKAWNNPEYDRACVHGFIDGNTGKVYQTLPWNYKGWHCGAGRNGSGNTTYIGIEMCEPGCISYGKSGIRIKNRKEARAVVERTYEAAVELFAFLCVKYKLDPMKEGVILSHSEGARKGIASNHGDPEHIWKDLGLGYSMDGFRKNVGERVKEMNGK